MNEEKADKKEVAVKADKFTVQLIVSILLASLILFGTMNTLMFQSIKSDLKSHESVIRNGK